METADVVAAAVFRSIRDARVAPHGRRRRLVEILKPHASERVRALPPSAWRGRVRAFIANGLVGGDCTLERIALCCGVGERTLRRRLAQAPACARLERGKSATAGVANPALRRRGERDE